MFIVVFPSIYYATDLDETVKCADLLHPRVFRNISVLNVVALGRFMTHIISTNKSFVVLVILIIHSLPMYIFLTSFGTSTYY